MKFIAIFLLALIMFCARGLRAQNYTGSFGLFNTPADTSGKVYKTNEVDKMPSYPQGNSDMMGFIVKNFVYPDDAKENNISGRIIIRFVVSPNGEIKDIEVLRKVYPSFDKETIRVIQAMPRWQPAEKNGLRVSCYYTLPIILDPE
jgi:TonB family protein